MKEGVTKNGVHVKQKKRMSNAKFKNLVVSCIVGAVLLLVILLGILIYQLITINVKSENDKKYLELKAYYDTLTEAEKKKIEATALRDYIEQEARKLGYKNPFDLD